MSSLAAGVGGGPDAPAAPASSAAPPPFDFATLPRTYDNALYLLSLLSTNRDVTSLFEVPQPGGGGAADLNAQALPEMRAWLARAGYPDPARDLAALRCVHISGTKGKGSVSAFVTAILQDAADVAATASAAAPAGSPVHIGRVGTYLSPHVVSVRERIWLDGQPLSRALFAQYTFELWARLSEAAAAADPADPHTTGAHTKPFYFRFLTLLALHVFVREGVRSAVVECGIGGAYDATNVLPPAAVTTSVVTRLGIDHVAMLGRTLPAIAWHKAGIFRPGVAAFTLGEKEADAGGNTGNADAEGPAERAAALAVLRARARELQASALYEIPPDAVARWAGVPGAALPGAFQKSNMALAAAAARHHLRVLGGGDSNGADALVDPATIPPRFYAALARATLRGRCERVCDAPSSGGAHWLIDGAHTADSLYAVGQFFAADQEDDGHGDQNLAATASPSSSSLPPQRILLFTLRDRSVAEHVRAVVAGAGNKPNGADNVVFDEAFFVFPPTATAERTAALETLARVSPHTAASMWDDVPSAVRTIRSRAADAASSARPCRVLATGSFVLVREVLQALGADGEA
ncbi:tetrahydrofolylpolyglutamate synthase [Niveomyces insectorum RCEF 264]|uniref:tetrahydrofolate synthase n=1 Tax=Niveomyces insectorum RCEF 264 TaxID=1081102 RepID=A0A167N9U9_9HYPO|nr:tetrahydrofolylpolyglutamate synthase [Niveomyces insectorum RCEF 264]